ncbi:class I SAM-dependent methyltransferase [Actinoplanes sp. RD1]|uniref:class I SAM-dependent methyltransferase n=1 Tax=Actinoplanes sp. RD1 TaxID=3064538 RepID=UPI0027407549|nr:class I SAM-dependent methyltransferase [Actinoplanes sp. RD1]
MSAYTAAAWQESWDRQQEGYLPDREQRFAAMLDAVEAVSAGGAPRVLDLAGGTGTISLRTLARFPEATTTVLDQDPVLLSLARSSLGGDSRAAVVSADLKSPRWAEALPHTEFDAVLTATALHWLPGERVAALYAEIASLLRPGGIFVNADHMPDDALPGLTKLLTARADAERTARQATGAALDWASWWARVAGDEELAPLLPERERLYPDSTHTEWNPPASWHVRALRDGGFAEAGILWRGGTDAAVIGMR